MEENTQLSLLFDEVIPIPECSELMKITKLKRPIDVADRMVQEVRVWQEKNTGRGVLGNDLPWQQKHPDRDVMEIITPDWEEYIKSRL